MSSTSQNRKDQPKVTKKRKILNLDSKEKRRNATNISAEKHLSSKESFGSDFDSESITNTQKHNTTNDVVKLGDKSIFYEEEWNPNGFAPLNVRNLSYNPSTFVRRGKEVITKLCGLQNIQIPKTHESKK
ncbi:hypothetical protein TPHA_0I01860 [Tetrapisispora phaffii CBS 4417]|uniref:Uncharacterized protein n=1 Tax=Tetrapisispora phaffii (strain ATCC 24235 / CBS 4417 / NBRC 1672 / NRRL Y-8282 / UCD 70-5) TaxID=1071381 RepID=G8BXR2_TETPH|nr:hypothetical protein TPHA_0I01860 [Tetrapisispora phaffii CBS 4417]CCE64690.1 hypothetical protein TPHA_0I01860 [Tetrapisispora phaffii CBS 4417]